MPTREYNFDGLVGPTHNYAGLSPGNLASEEHTGQLSNPRQAALQGLSKMAYVASLGGGQAVLPPHPRPSLRTLRQLGFTGTDREIILRAAKENEQLLRLCSSAAAMWAANAATCAPSADTADGRMHITPANLRQMFHRAIEAETTHRVLKAIFSDEHRFAVHDPLPGGGQFADEGAANHLRLCVRGGEAVHLFAWGRSAYRRYPGPGRFPARQTLEASQALARLHQLSPARCFFIRQPADAIDAGAFHTDVLAVANDSFLMLHQRAFVNPAQLLGSLRKLLGPEFRCAVGQNSQLPLAAAVKAYPFNSQLLTVPDGSMVIVAPKESETSKPARTFLEQVKAQDNPVRAIHYLDVRQSMKNGGGPACLRQRIWLSDEEKAAISANVFFTPALHETLEQWVLRHYRDRLSPKDLGDPKLADESMSALDQLSGILGLGSVYDFQR
jgi:succinylarginine dihydrolase